MAPYGVSTVVRHLTHQYSMPHSLQKHVLRGQGLGFMDDGKSNEKNNRKENENWAVYGGADELETCYLCWEVPDLIFQSQTNETSRLTNVSSAVCPLQ